ncbi:hypothetical protein [Limosilactobacillus fermentum]
MLAAGIEVRHITEGGQRADV